MMGRRVLLGIGLCALALVVILSCAFFSDADLSRGRTELSDWTKPRKAHPRRGAFKKVSKQAKLIKWAEAHGLPKSLANNPKDASKVKHIIARMKADLVVERIQNQMKKDDSSVTSIMHMSDPNAAGIGR